MVYHMICGLCFPLFLLVCFVCIVEIFVPRVSSLQSLTLGTRVLFCGLSWQVVGVVQGTQELLVVSEMASMLEPGMSTVS